MSIGLRAPSYGPNLVDPRLNTYGISGTRDTSGVNSEIVLLAEYTLRYPKVRTKLRYLRAYKVIKGAKVRVPKATPYPGPSLEGDLGGFRHRAPRERGLYESNNYHGPP